MSNEVAFFVARLVAIENSGLPEAKAIRRFEKEVFRPARSQLQRLRIFEAFQQLNRKQSTPLTRPLLKRFVDLL